MIKGNFIDNLPKIYGIYTGGFIAFIIIMAIGEQMGMTSKAIGISFVAFTVAIYAIIGWLSRTAQASNYYVAAPSPMRADHDRVRPRIIRIVLSNVGEDKSFGKRYFG
jgi:hypothetical protein